MTHHSSPVAAEHLAKAIESGSLALIWCHPSGNFPALDAADEHLKLIVDALRRPAQTPLERLPVEKLAKHFRVSVEQAQAAQDDIGFMYRELASPVTSTVQTPVENKDDGGA